MELVAKRLQRPPVLDRDETVCPVLQDVWCARPSERAGTGNHHGAAWARDEQSAGAAGSADGRSAMHSFWPLRRTNVARAFTGDGCGLPASAWAMDLCVILCCRPKRWRGAQLRSVVVSWCLARLSSQFSSVLHFRIEVTKRKRHFSYNFCVFHLQRTVVKKCHRQARTQKQPSQGFR